ncbi:hypothetical protein C0992_000221 [Termitomyces sp. T32_za158]|nr:hypothetical protein C0992_000221 [Termitomyces sp. T32_za158]
MYHRHHAWQHHHLYPTDPWPEYSDALAPPAPPPNTAPYTHDLLAPRLALAGSLDPATGIFYRSPEHPRLRTAQACEKCRTRKAKCSGEHPTCKRCANRGLVCEYAKEGRVRGPNKPKQKHTEPAKKTGESSTAAADTTDLLAPRDLQRRPVRPRPQHLRIDQVARQPHAHTHTHTPTPHSPAPFPALYAAPDCVPSPTGRRSCSLSESGGSVPSSAVSATFDLSPSQPTAPRYPAGTHIHQLTHEQQQRLLASDLPTGHFDAHAHIPQEFDHHAQYAVKQEQEHDPRFVVEPAFPVLHAPQQQQQQQQHIPELEYPAWAGYDAQGRAYGAHGYIHHHPHEFRS